MIGQIRLLSGLLIACIVVLTIAGLGLFTTKLFPMRNLLTLSDSSPTSPKERRFGKVVFMVIDALRPDFVYNTTSQMKTIQRLIKTGTAIPFVANVQPPTVTLPRLKAMTIGNNPEFLDVIWNVLEMNDVNTGEMGNTDNVITRIRDAGNNVYLFGDETWLRLFGSNVFKKADGTLSLFVNDYTFVDTNVTRHLSPELLNKKTITSIEWDLMILHYLGVDHIGHKFGPFSEIMLEKENEMDKVVSSIYDKLTELEKLEKETNPNALPSLFVVLGDHGMTDDGQHGGVGSIETKTAVVFISNAFTPKDPALSKKTVRQIEPQMIEQSDICPTLANVFGVVVPANNIGTNIDEIFQFKNDLYNGDDELMTLERIVENSKQIKSLLSKIGNSNEKAERLFSTALSHFTTLNKHSDKHIIAENYQQFLKFTRYGFELMTSISLLNDKTSLLRNLAPGFMLTSLAFFLCCGVLYKLLKHSLFERKLKSPAVQLKTGYSIALLLFFTFLFASILFIWNAFNTKNTTLDLVLVFVVSFFCSIGVVVFVYVDQLLFFLFPRKWSSSESVIHPKNNEADRFSERVKWIVLLFFFGVCFFVHPFLGFGTSYIVNENYVWKLMLSSYLVLGLFLKVVFRWKTQSKGLLITVCILLLLRLVTVWESCCKTIPQTYVTVFSALSTIAFIFILNFYFHNHTFKQFTTATLHVYVMLYGVLLGLAFIIMFFPDVFENAIPFSASSMRFIVYICSAVAFVGSFFWPLVSQRGIREKGFQMHAFFVLMLYSLLPVMFLIHRPHNIPLIFLWFLIGALFIRLCSVENVDWLVITEKAVSCYPSPCTLMHRTLCRCLILWVFGRAAFFSFGNGNSVSDIDFQMVYEGLPYYSNVVVFGLGFLSVYTGPILYFFVALTVMMMESEYQEIAIHNAFEQTLHLTSLVLIARSVFSILVEMLIMSTMQGEIFIWTCFAPKYLYDCVEVLLTLVFVILQSSFSSFLNVLFFDHRKHV